MFSKNDTVMYATQGVCTITDIIEKDLYGKTVTYYVLKPVYSETALIYIPTNNEALTGKMRKVLSKEEIYSMIQNLPEENLPWEENEHVRKEQYKQILAEGDRRALAGMIKALYLHKQELSIHGKKLHIADERFFKDAEKMLYDEFAMVLGIETDQVVSFIQKELDPRKDEL